MAFYFPNTDTTYIYRREPSEYISITQEGKVTHGRIILQEIPDFDTKVTVENDLGNPLTEVDINTTILTEEQYKVDYTSGIIFFHESKEGNTFKNFFKGSGYVAMPASRIFMDGYDNPVTSIQDMVNANKVSYIDEYDIAMTYNMNDIVSFNGSSYIAKVRTTGNTPTELPDDPNWGLISRKGADGTGTVTTHEDVFIATQGQRSFTLKHTYDQFQHRTQVFVGGVPQTTPENYEETSSNVITLSEGVSAGVKVVVRYFSESIPLQSDIQTTVDNHTVALSDHAIRLTDVDTRIDSVEQDMVNKTKEIVDMSSFQVVGDGNVDDSVLLQQAFDASQGKVLMLEKGRVYSIPDSKTIEIKSNTTIISNGAKFKKLTTGTNYVLNISGTNVKIDNLSFIPFPSEVEVGVKITGNNVTIDRFECIGLIEGTGGNSISRNALFVDGTNGMLKDIKIGHIHITDWVRPIQIRNAKNVHVDSIEINKYRTAVYLRDVNNSKFSSAHIYGMGKGILGNPGENGILIESRDADYGCQKITIENWVVEDSGEHGYRIGGSKIAADITFSNCVARRPGRGMGVGGLDNGHGGCGFKALGSTVDSSRRHRNIRYVNCTAEDGRSDKGDGLNFSGFYIGKCVNVTIDNPIVRTNGVSTSARGFTYGINIVGSEEVTISNPNIGYVTRDGIYMFDYKQEGYYWGEYQSRIIINGGIIHNPVNAGIRFKADHIMFRRIHVNGTLIESGDALYSLKAEKSGNGSFNQCSIDSYLAPVTFSKTLDGMNDFLIDCSGVFTNTPNHAANGSIFRAIDGEFRIRKDGKWVLY